MSITRKCRMALANEHGFSLAETMVGAAVLAVVGVALFSGITMSVATAKVNTENLRATQILTEKMDLIRACEWARITNGYTFIPRTFMVPFYTAGPTTRSLLYTGTVTIAQSPATESYRDSLRQVTITLAWRSGNVPRARSMTTLVSPYGIENYSH